MPRSVLSAAAVSFALVGASLVAGAGTSAAQSADTVRVVNLTIDGLHPSQIGSDTPNLQQLKDAGVWYEQHRSVMSSETLPNHVAMATGTYPATNSLPGNDGRDQPGDTEAIDLGPPELRTADSFTVAVERVCPDLRTLTVFAKPYVHRSLGGEADADFNQANFNVPVAETAPDATLMSFLVPEIAQNGFGDYSFISLGDVDRSGHVDANAFSGVTGFQRAALAEADLNVGILVQALQQTGEWERTVMVVNSDHSMDFTPPLTGNVDLEAALEGDPATAGKFFVASNGGAGFVYLLEPSAPDAESLLVAARGVLQGLTGVDEALYREPNSLDPGADLRSVHPGWRNWTHRAGEIFVTVHAGSKVGSTSSNPLPGNHGMVATRHATMMVTGGWPGINAGTVISADPALVDIADDTEVLLDQSEQVDIAPTFGWLLGVPDPGISGGAAAQWEGRVLEEAFSTQPAPACVGDVVAPEPQPEPAPEPDPEPLPATGGGLAAVALGLAFLVRRGLPSLPAGQP